jgi:hypothetical protein
VAISSVSTRWQPCLPVRWAAACTTTTVTTTSRCPEKKGGLPELMLFHDVGHVVSGYGVDPQGEIQQAAFQAGFARDDGVVFLLFGILQFHIGLRITPVAKGEHGYFDVPSVLQALSRGAACRVDFSDGFDFFRCAPEPLKALRVRWGVPALPS